MIEILSTGAPNTVQDLGRNGFLDIGVGQSGAMDPFALALGNALLGNDPAAAGIEVALFPFRLKFHGAGAVAITGVTGGIELSDRTLPPAWAVAVAAGDTLTLAPPLSGGRAIVTFRGGLDVPIVLGSRSTDLKGGFGGLEGRGLKRGDRIALLPAPPPSPALKRGYGAVPPQLLTLPRDGAPMLLRVLPAAEMTDFTPEARAALTGADWVLTADANRQGYRLAGPDLAMTTRRELFSHGIRPGIIQVPPSNQPIIQLADANTCGGYPKIASVIEADLWKLAHLPVGGRIQFVMVSRDEAIRHLRAQRQALEEVRRSVREMG